MYQNPQQPPPGAPAPQQFPQGQQVQQHPKNPNGGYLKPSDYGADQFFGALTITWAMLQQLLAQGNGSDVKINVKVNELKNGQYGAYRRITANPLTPEQQARMSSVVQTPAQPVQQVQPVIPTGPPQVYAPGSVMDSQAPLPPQQPQYQAPVQQPAQVQYPAPQAETPPILEDAIPF